MIPARPLPDRECSWWGSRQGAGLLPHRSETDGGRDAASDGSGRCGSWRACRSVTRVTVNLNVKEGNPMPQTTVRAVVELACNHVPAARVAEITGLDPAEVSRWRNGGREPRVDRFLGCLARLVSALPELAEELSEVTGLPLRVLVTEPPPAGSSSTPDNVVDFAVWRARRAA